MAGKEFDFVGKFGWEEVWELDFSKIKVLETSALFINMVLESLLNIFGGGKDQLFDVLVRVFPVSPETDLVKLKKTFRVELIIIILKRKRLLRPRQRRKSFLIVNLPLENCSLRLITWVESHCFQQQDLVPPLVRKPH